MGTFLPTADADGHDAAADIELVRRTHGGDVDAFGELWRRHYRHALAATAAVTGRPDPRLTRESFTRSWTAIVGGARPRGAFRAFLLTQIAASAAESGASPAAPGAVAAEDAAAADAYRQLFADQQELLWYSEIEGMSPAQIAPLVHAAPTAAAKLIDGARRELRRVWAKPCREAVPEDSPCRWTRDRLAPFAEDALPTRDAEAAREHLATCDDCATIAAEAKLLPARLAVGVLPAVLGAEAATAYLESVGSGRVPPAEVPSLPATIAAAAVLGLDGWVSASTLDARTPAEVAERSLSASAGAATAAGGQSGARRSTAVSYRPASRRRGIPSARGITAVLLAGAVVAGGVAFATVAPTLPPATQTSEGTERAFSGQTADASSSTRVPLTSLDSIPVSEVVPPANGPSRGETSPSAPEERSFAPRDVFLPPVSSPSAPSPAPALPRQTGTHTVPARASQPTSAPRLGTSKPSAPKPSTSTPKPRASKPSTSTPAPKPSTSTPKPSAPKPNPSTPSPNTPKPNAPAPDGTAPSAGTSPGSPTTTPPAADVPGANSPDTSSPDTGSPDSGSPDFGSPDTGSSDTPSNPAPPAGADAPGLTDFIRGSLGETP